MTRERVLAQLLLCLVYKEEANLGRLDGYLRDIEERRIPELRDQLFPLESGKISIKEKHLDGVLIPGEAAHHNEMMSPTITE